MAEMRGISRLYRIFLFFFQGKSVLHCVTCNVLMYVFGKFLLRKCGVRRTDNIVSPTSSNAYF